MGDCTDFRPETYVMSFLENMNVLTIGLCGATCSGKTSLAKDLQKVFQHAIVISQDYFYLEEELGPKSSDGIFMWDVPEAVNQRLLLQTVQEARTQPQLVCRQCLAESSERISASRHIVVVEGSMVLAMQELTRCLDMAFFVTLDQETCRQRRSERKYDGLEDPPGYFDRFLWPAYLKLQDSVCLHSSLTVVLEGGLPLPELLKTLSTHITRSLPARTA